MYVIGTNPSGKTGAVIVTVRNWYAYHESQAAACGRAGNPCAGGVLVQQERSERMKYPGKGQDAVTAAFRGFYRALDRGATSNLMCSTSILWWTSFSRKTTCATASWCCQTRPA